MAGVGGVKVAPEARGRGVGRALMTALLDAMAERGYPLSALYPATAQLYRSLGWEMAGGHYRAEVPGRSLGSLLPPDPRIPAPAGPAAAAVPAANCCPRCAGPARRTPRRSSRCSPRSTPPPATAARRRSTRPACGAGWPARDLFSYLAPDGFLGYGWHGGRRPRDHGARAGGRSAPTARALWGIVASHASVTAGRPRRRRPRRSDRLADQGTRRPPPPAQALDAPGARPGRRDQRAAAFPPRPVRALCCGSPTTSRPAGAGLHTLTVRDGQGSLLPGITERSAGSPAREPVRLGPRGFAALYAGVPMATLRVAGLAAGGDPGRRRGARRRLRRPALPARLLLTRPLARPALSARPRCQGLATRREGLRRRGGPRAGNVAAEHLFAI